MFPSCRTHLSEQEFNYKPLKNNKKMRKFLFLSIAAMALIFAGCERDDIAKNLVGTWTFATESISDYDCSFTFTEDQFILTNNTDGVRYEGSYTIDKDDILLLNCEKLFQLDLDDDYFPIPDTWHEVQLDPNDAPTSERKVLLKYDNNVLLMLYRDFESSSTWGSSDNFDIYFRTDAAINTPAKDVVGQWNWLLDDGVSIHGFMELTNSAFDIIVPVWRMRMEGTYTYEGGDLKFHLTKISRRLEFDDMFLPEYLYDNWEEVSVEDMIDQAPFGVDFTCPFIAVDNEAYSLFANIPAHYVKK